MGRGDIRCAFYCASQTVEFLKALDLNAPGPDGTKLWGQEMCDRARADPNYPGGALDLEYLDSFQRVCSDQLEDWEFNLYYEEANPKICCDQLGRYVPGCP